MSRLKRFFGGLFVLVWASTLGASGVPQAEEAQRALQFDVDFARFRTNSDFVYLEVYYSLFRNQLRFVKDGDKHRLRADFRIISRIFMDDSLIVQDDIKNVTYADKIEDVTASQQLTNLSKFIIKKGNYTLRVRVEDLHSGRFGNMEMALPIEDFSQDQLDMSDIELASILRPNPEPDRFTKNHYQVIPNPMGIYGIEAPILYFYSEIYNFAQNGEKKQYRCRYAILDSKGNEVRKVQEKVKNKPGGSAVEAAGFNVVSLRSGTYFLQVEIEDLDSGQRTSAVKKFYVYRKADFQQLADQATSISAKERINAPEYQVYDTMTEKELDAEFNGATYIATSNDKKIYKSLDLKGKRQFMKRFWLVRDPNPQTLVNEFRQEYLARLRYVNTHFGVGKPGWKSDRGRVFLIYGKPDEVERFPNSNETRAYEVWNYYKVQGGVIFVFVDVRGFGDYQLVHSTARDELQDQDWQRWIYVQ